MENKTEILKKILQDTSKLLGTAIENQSIDTKADTLKIAQLMKDTYDSYVLVGFTEEQSLKLVTSFALNQTL
ncbi:hypothetical protein AAK894_04445 [Lachnospiraceae bacterium 46-61]|mgnify:CR=1 FL=1